jgi:hypothetical protein
VVLDSSSFSITLLVAEFEPILLLMTAEVKKLKKLGNLVPSADL